MRIFFKASAVQRQVKEQSLPLDSGSKHGARRQPSSQALGSEQPHPRQEAWWTAGCPWSQANTVVTQGHSGAAVPAVQGGQIPTGALTDVGAGQPACVTAAGANRERWGAGIAVKHLLLSGFMRGLGAVPACSSVADWTSALSVL